jgi:hypothetical protein
MDDKAYEALQQTVARLTAETEAALQELLAEIRRRDQLAEIEARQPGTVHPIRPGPGNS